MKLENKSSKALVVGGIILAGAFVLTAIVRPQYLDWILHPGEERNDRIKEEMDRQKGIGSDARPGQGEQANSGAKTPTPSPEMTAQAGDEEVQIDPKPGCIPRDQVVKTIYASEEARSGRVIWVSV